MIESSVTPILECRFAPPVRASEGVFSGVASAYGVVDSYGTAFAPGAFKRSLEEHRTQDTLPAMLWAHDSKEPVGRWLSIEEQSDGLHVKGKLTLATTRGAQALALLNDGALGLSVGFARNPDKQSRDARTGVVTFHEAKLLEISLVAMPSNHKARIKDVRAMTARDLEREVRDALGLSARQARRLLSGGYTALVRDERDESAELTAVADQLRRITSQLKQGMKS